jgi:hypothetical protein
LGFALAGAPAKKESARRVLKEMGVSASGICSVEQPRPGHNDLKGRYLVRVVRRALRTSHKSKARQLKVIHRYSQPAISAFSRYLADEFAGNFGLVVAGGVVGHRLASRAGRRFWRLGAQAIGGRIGHPAVTY